MLTTMFVHSAAVHYGSIGAMTTCFQVLLGLRQNGRRHFVFIDMAPEGNPLRNQGC